MPTEVKKADVKRYTIGIPFHIEEITEDGTTKPFFDCVLDYHDMTYEDVVAVQAAMIKLLESLNGYGMSYADSLGMSEKLKALGLAKKP